MAQAAPACPRRCRQAPHFRHTARSVIDPRGQRVDARDRLYLAESVPTMLMWGENDRNGTRAHAPAMPDNGAPDVGGPLGPALATQSSGGPGQRPPAADLGAHRGRGHAAHQGSDVGPCDDPALVAGRQDRRVSGADLQRLVPQVH